MSSTSPSFASKSSSISSASLAISSSWSNKSNIAGFLDPCLTIGSIPDTFVRIKLLPEDDEEPLAPLHNLDNKFAGCCCPVGCCPIGSDRPARCI